VAPASSVAGAGELDPLSRIRSPFHRIASKAYRRVEGQVVEYVAA
jgi:hypothetical protein